MPICIECGLALTALYTTYSKADDRSLGKGVRLVQCPRCKRFADKYVEHDYVVIFIDLVLIKPQVYRHLLFNRLGRDDDKLDKSIIRLGILLLLFDVYLTWARIERATSPGTYAPPLPSISSSTTHDRTALSNSTASGPSPLLELQARPGPSGPFSAFLSSQPIITQYIFFLTLVFSETAAFHLPIRWLLSVFPPSPSEGTTTTTSTTIYGPRSSPSLAAPNPTESRPGLLTRLIPYYPYPSKISTALLVSSFTKLFPLLLLIWSYDLPSSASAVSWAVIVNNVAALEICVGCGYPRAVGLAAVGAAARALVGWVVLRAVGVESGVAAAGVVETGDLVEVWRWVVRVGGTIVGGARG